MCIRIRIMDELLKTNNMRKIMLACVMASMLAATSCTPDGTLENMNTGEVTNICRDPRIEVYRYYYKNDNFVYVARFKDQPNVVTTTWDQYKSPASCVTIYENDSVVILKKK